jgi:hypothetical protein
MHIPTIHHSGDGESPIDIPPPRVIDEMVFDDGDENDLRIPGCTSGPTTTAVPAADRSTTAGCGPSSRSGPEHDTISLGSTDTYSEDESVASSDSLNEFVVADDVIEYDDQVHRRRRKRSRRDGASAASKHRRSNTTRGGDRPVVVVGDAPHTTGTQRTPRDDERGEGDDDDDSDSDSDDDSDDSRLGDSDFICDTSEEEFEDNGSTSSSDHHASGKRRERDARASRRQTANATNGESVSSAGHADNGDTTTTTTDTSFRCRVSVEDIRAIVRDTLTQVSREGHISPAIMRDPSTPPDDQRP